MAWYRTGTISVTNGSATVTGAGTAFIANAVAIGESLQAPDGKLYEITAVVSETSLTLATVYAGPTLTGQTYAIAPTQSYLRDLASQAASVINEYDAAADAFTGAATSATNAAASATAAASSATAAAGSATAAAGSATAADASEAAAAASETAAANSASTATTQASAAATSATTASTQAGNASTSATAAASSATAAAGSATAAASSAASIVASTEKTTPVDADAAVLLDSAAGGALKKLTFANLWAWAKAKIESTAVAIGGTTPSTGAFTTLSATGAATVDGTLTATAIATAASGNLTSTTLNAALAELQADVDTRAITYTHEAFRPLTGQTGQSYFFSGIDRPTWWSPTALDYVGGEGYPVVGNTTKRNAISAWPIAPGYKYWNTDINMFERWYGTAWWDDIRHLFAASEKGVWYDPSDFANTLFQDSAGTTPVTAVTQPVGLMLDKSQGLVLGPELVDTMNTAAAWTRHGTNTIEQDVDAVKITFVDAGAGAFSYFGAIYGLNSNLTVGAFYEVNYEVKINSGSCNVLLNNPGANTNTAVTSTSYIPQQFIFKANLAANDYIQFSNLSAGEIVWIRNISVRELPGYHATQSTSTARPVLGREPIGGRRNLLTYTEDFGNAAWVKTSLNGSISSGIVSPSGAVLQKYTESTSTSTQRSFYQIVSVPAGNITFTCEAKNDGRRYCSLYPQGATSAWAIFDLQDGVITATGLASYVSSSIEDVGGGVFKCSLTCLATAGNVYCAYYLSNTPTSPASGYNGDGVSGVYVGALMVELGSTPTAYQKVVSALDVTEAGVNDAYYLKFDGVDDFMVTPAIDFSGTDKMTLVAGVYSTANGATIVAELSASAATNNGSFCFGDGSWVVGGDRIGGMLRGTLMRGYDSPATFARPLKYVNATAYNIAGITGAEEVAERINGVSQTLQTNGGDNSAGTGNFGNYPLYIGRRAGTSLPFNGHLYSLVVRGALSDAAQITASESYVAGKTGVTL